MNKSLIITIISLAFISLQSCDRQCKKTECLNNGSCYEGECLCEKWYSGDQCELMYNRNYDGVYLGSYAPSSSSLMPRRRDSIVVIADATVPNRLNIENGFYYELVSDSSIVIPSQSFYASDYLVKVEGSGGYSADRIQLKYTQTSNTDSGVIEESVIFIGTKD